MARSSRPAASYAFVDARGCGGNHLHEVHGDNVLRRHLPSRDVRIRVCLAAASSRDVVEATSKPVESLARHARVLACLRHRGVLAA
jgi:hypothetical protein